MELGSSKGQVFTVTATLLISLIIIMFISTTNLQPEQDSSTFRNWFDKSFENIPNVFNSAIEEENSINNAKKDIYSYNQFIERRSRSKGIDYTSSYFLIFPDSGEAIFINYQESDKEVNIMTGSSWSNTTVGPKQELELSYTPGQTDFSLIIPSDDIDESFTASNPRIFGRMRMSSNDQVWINSGLN